MKYSLFLMIFLFSFSTFSKVKRIDEKEMDLSKPFRIFMTSGRSTILEFPCEINHTVLGLEEEIKLKTGPDNKKTVALWLMNSQVQPTNLTVKCDEEYYVFDIVPNNHTHQDFINIVDAFDSRRSKKLELVAHSGDKTRRGPKSSRFEVRKKDLLHEITSSQKPGRRKKKKDLDDLVLERLNKNTKPRRLIKTLSSQEFFEEIRGKNSKKERF